MRSKTGTSCRKAACSEAVANSIEHGYSDDPFGVVDVSATISAETVEIQVGDRGRWRGPP